jgi:peroxiredoxin Q/BCP
MFRKSLLIAASLFAIIGASVIMSTHTSASNKSSFADDKPKGELKEGMLAPDFTLSADDGKQIKLSKYRGKQTVVLYFYPKDETPGCTKQACAFRDSLADYRKENIEVLGVSVDTVEAHKAFKKNQRLNFTLLADADKKVSEQYGVLSERGYSTRTTFVIGKDGRIKKIYQKVDPALNAAEVLAFARTL